MQRNVGIVSVHDDLHAYIVATELKERHDANCHVFETDRFAFKGGYTWSPTGERPARLPDYFGETCELDQLTKIWWRRFSRYQSDLPSLLKEHEADLIQNDVRSAVLGMFETLPEQVFANAPQATDRAANKIVQLRAATTCSLRIPKTLVSSDRREIVDFIKGLPRRAIVKTLIGTAKSIVFTNTITLEDIEGALVESVPGIYQECIEGYCHLRLNVFGQKIVGARIRSEELDWRRLLPRDVEIVQVESGLHSSVLSLMNRLNLQMGMVDLKINGQGDIVFLEVNPQGQFLFLEPLTGYPFRSEFADFLLNTSQDGERN